MGREGRVGVFAGKKRTERAREVRHDNQEASRLANRFASVLHLREESRRQEQEEEAGGTEEVAVLPIQELSKGRNSRGGEGIVIGPGYRQGTGQGEGSDAEDSSSATRAERGCAFSASPYQKVAHGGGAAAATRPTRLLKKAGSSAPQAQAATSTRSEGESSSRSNSRGSREREDNEHQRGRVSSRRLVDRGIDATEDEHSLEDGQSADVPYNDDADENANNHDNWADDHDEVLPPRRQREGSASDDSWRVDSATSAAGNTTESDSDSSEEQQAVPVAAAGGGRGRGRGGNTRPSAAAERRDMETPSIIPRPNFESLLTKEEAANIAEVDGLLVKHVNTKSLATLTSCPMELASYLPKVKCEYRLVVAVSPVSVVIEDEHIPEGMTVGELKNRICFEISRLGKAVSPSFTASIAKRKGAAAASDVAETRSAAQGRQRPTESERAKDYCFHKMRKLSGCDLADALTACGILEVTVFVYGNAAKVGNGRFFNHPYVSHYFAPGCLLEIDVAMTLRCEGGHVYRVSSGDALHTKTYPIDAEMSGRTCFAGKGGLHGSLLIAPQSKDSQDRAYMDFPCSSREELLELDMLGKRLHGISSIKVYSPEFHAISCVSKMDVQHVGALTKTISSKLDQCQVILEEYEALLATHKRLMAERQQHGAGNETAPYISGIRIETRFRRECPAGFLALEDMNTLVELARQIAVYLVRRIGFQRVDVERGIERSKAMLGAARTIFAGKRGERALKTHRNMMAILMQVMGFTGPRIENFALNKDDQGSVRVTLQEYESEADEIREVLSLSQGQVLEEMVAQVSAEDKGEEGGWRAHARGTTRLIGGMDHTSLIGAPLFSTKRKLCDALLTAFGRRWRLHVEMLPAARRAQELLRMERETSRKARDVPYPVCPPIAMENGIGQLHAWKYQGDRRHGGSTCLSHATVEARVDEMIMTQRLMECENLFITRPPTGAETAPPGAQAAAGVHVVVVATPVLDAGVGSTDAPYAHAQAVPARPAA